MKDAVIIGGVRTPIGTHGGALRAVTAQDLLATCFSELLRRTGVSPKVFDDVIVGCVSQQSDATNIARVVALMAGVSTCTPAYTVQRNCVSGMMAITNAVQGIRSGDGETYLCGGTESMSNAPYMVRGARWGLKLRHTTFIDTLWEGLTDPVCGQIMGLTAENLAMMYGLTREQLDKYAVESHKKAFMATRMGRFRDEIVPVRVAKKIAGQEVAHEEIVQDEGINPTLSMQKAALYPTIFKKGGVVTPANSCPISDGAAATILMSKEKAASLGLKPDAVVRSFAYAGIPPEIMGLGPAFSIPKALERAGLKLLDIDLIELNEAFAAQVVPVGMELEDEGWDWNKVNVNGGAIALGHPVGSTGTRQVVTILNEMKKRGVALGMTTACVGGGMGGTLIVERLN